MVPRNFLRRIEILIEVAKGGHFWDIFANGGFFAKSCERKTDRNCDFLQFAPAIAFFGTF